MSLELPLPCIICGFQPETTDTHDEDKGNTPYAATAFVTHGHYGSTAFDPLDGTFIEINVCDTCLVRKAETGCIGEGRDHKPVLNASGAQTGMEKIPYKQQPKLKIWDAA